MSETRTGMSEPKRLRFGDGEPVVSVITVFNDAGTLERCLLTSLRRQCNIAFEWIGIDNTDGAFRSAAEALNAGAARARGDTLLFAHQDVVLHGDHWILDLHAWLERLPDAGIAGVMGRRDDGSFAGFMRDRSAVMGTPHTAALEVQTLDECVLAMPAGVFERHPFDESFGGWHVYGVDACLRVRGAGLRVYVLPLFVHHDSAGTNLDGLAAAHEWVHHRHKRAEPIIHTTCGTIDGAGLRRVAARRAVVGTLVRAAGSVGVRVAHGPNAYLQQIGERLGEVLVLHFAPRLPSSVPAFTEADALAPHATATLHVRHAVIQQDDDASAIVRRLRAEREPRLVVLEEPVRSSDEQLHSVRAALAGSRATVLAASAAHERDALLERLSTAGWNPAARPRLRPRLSASRRAIATLPI